MEKAKFKVIVVGGGPVGLTAAHALSQAGIDYVVLEHRTSVTMDVGASLALWPQALRVLAQLGLRERLESIGADITRSATVTLDGHKYKESWAPETVKTNHGVSMAVFHRADFLSALYDNLSDEDKSRILKGKKVTDISISSDGVQVRCADGSEFLGSMIIGADGVHSRVRNIMRALAVKSSSKEINEENPYKSEFRALWCSFPRPPTLEAGETSESHGSNVSIQCLNGQDKSWIFIYERLDKATHERTSYSQDQIEAVATRYANLAINEHLKVKDVFRNRHLAGMTNLEEGIVPHWSWNRIVLVGDACHKFTPNQGLGYNNGLQDVVVLVNELCRLVTVDHSIDSDCLVTLDALTGAFSRYKASRLESVKKDYQMSAGYTRMCIWQTFFLHLLDRYILPIIPKFDNLMVTFRLAGPISKSPILEFIEMEEPYQGKVAWVNAIKRPEQKMTV